MLRQRNICILERQVDAVIVDAVIFFGNFFKSSMR